MKKQFLSIFSGIGGSAFGAKMAGYDLLGAIEFDHAIADLYKMNHQSPIAVDNVASVDLTDLPERNKNVPLCVQLSPPCQDYSAANHQSNQGSDRALALDHCYKILEYYRPEEIVIENVRAYQKSQSITRLKNWLTRNGYQYIEQVLNCADVGVPQSRIRYFLIATKRSLQLKKVKKTHEQHPNHQLNIWESPKQEWNGWLNAIEDLIEDLPVTELSQRQIEAVAKQFTIEPLQVEGRTRSRAETNRADRVTIRNSSSPSMTVVAGNNGVNMPKFLIPTVGYYGRVPPIYGASDLSPTVKAMMMSDKGYSRHGCWRISDGYNIRECSTRVLGRLQTFPDKLILSGKNNLDCKAIGNAVPPLAMQRVLECFN